MIYRKLQTIPKADHEDVLAIYAATMWRGVTLWKRTSSADTYLFCSAKSVVRQYLREQQWSSSAAMPTPGHIDELEWDNIADLDDDC